MKPTAETIEYTAILIATLAPTLLIPDEYLKMEITDLKTRIKSENAKARASAKKSLDHIRVCGEMLIAMKSRVEHGNWMLEVYDFGMSQKCISNYMRIARNWQQVANLNYGVKDTLKILKRQDTPPRGESSPESPFLVSL